MGHRRVTQQRMVAMAFVETGSVGARECFWHVFNAEYADSACFICGISYEVESEIL